MNSRYDGCRVRVQDKRQAKQRDLSDKLAKVKDAKVPVEECSEREGMRLIQELEREIGSVWSNFVRGKVDILLGFSRNRMIYQQLLEKLALELQSKLDIEIYLSSDVRQRFNTSFGAWSMLENLLGPFEFLRLQALNRYAYNTGISRCQVRWTAPKPICALTCIGSEAYEHGFFSIDQRKRGLRAYFNDTYLIGRGMSTILVGDSLFVFTFSMPVTV